MKIEIVHYGDWSAIFKDGKRIHWHDTPNASGMCHLLGIDCNTHQLEDFTSNSEQLQELEDFMPDTWDELQDKVKSFKKEALRREIDERQQELDLLRGDLEDIENDKVV